MEWAGSDRICSQSNVAIEGGNAPELPLGAGLELFFSVQAVIAEAGVYFSFGSRAGMKRSCYASFPEQGSGFFANRHPWFAGIAVAPFVKENAAWKGGCGQECPPSKVLLEAVSFASVAGGAECLQIVEPAGAAQS